MPTVCNAIIPQLVVTLPANCAQFSENQIYSAACGSGTATDSCALAISGGTAPYTTTFSYLSLPIAEGCTLSTTSFTGGTGANPQFGYSFVSSNMCSLSIMGNLIVSYTVTDASGQTVTGVINIPVSVSRTVQSNFGISGGSGGNLEEI